MKMIFILLFLIIPIFSLNSQSGDADYCIYYEFKFITDISNKEYSTPEMYITYKVDQTSYFYNCNEYFNDSISIDFEQKMGKGFQNDPKKLQSFNQDLMPMMKKYKTNYSLLKDYKKKTIIMLLTTDPGRSKYMELPLKLDWEILSENDSIAGFWCKKAITKYGGREYIAWFTESIPISDGPYVFNGLPGLILRVIDKDQWYEFNISKIISKKTTRFVDPYILNPYVQTKISRAEFVNSNREMKDNPQFPSGMMNVTPEMKLRLKERYKKRFDLLLEQNE